MVLLGSSSNKGLAYIETSNIDGETNYKIRECMVPDLVHPTECLVMKGRIECEDPNDRIHTFNGTLHMEGKPVSYLV